MSSVLADHRRKQERLAEQLRKADLAAVDRRVYTWTLRVSAPRQPSERERRELAELIERAASRLIEAGLLARDFRGDWRVQITPTFDRTEVRCYLGHPTRWARPGETLLDCGCVEADAPANHPRR